MGQGAEAALPILGLYMKGVYNDSSLPYSQKTKFNFPAGYNPCGDELGVGGGGWRGGGGGHDDGGGGHGDVIEGIFD